MCSKQKNILLMWDMKKKKIVSSDVTKLSWNAESK